MKLLYNGLFLLIQWILPLFGLFSDKMKRFTQGRRHIFDDLKPLNRNGSPCIWMHCASLGEFEQGRPVLEALKSLYPDKKILLTFFSPSGYEVQKEYAGADVITYMPLDNRRQCQKFIKAANPQMAVFVKYEFWPNMLDELRSNHIPTFLISGIFRSDQPFFHWYGRWMIPSLQAFTHFFLQDQRSIELLATLDFNNVTLSGDTRFDRVATIKEQHNAIKLIDELAADKKVFVAGSTWPSDEEALIQFINRHEDSNFVYILAPHYIDQERISRLMQRINKPSSRYSDSVLDTNSQVLILDTIGILTKVYSYADIAYVGGAFDKEGVHNVLEPAVFGVPIVIGPIYDKFIEAVELVEKGGCQVVDTPEALVKQLLELCSDDAEQKKMGDLCSQYLKEKTGATKMIIDRIEQILKD